MHFCENRKNTTGKSGYTFPVVFKLGEGWQSIRVTRCKGVKAVRETTIAPKWLDKKQRAALLRAVDKGVEDAKRRYPRLRLMYLRDAAIVKLILYAGLRVGEIIQLRMSDVSLDDRKGSVIVREGKGTKRREIPLNAKARKAILAYLRIRPDVENNYLSLGQRNEAIKSKTVQ